MYTMNTTITGTCQVAAVDASVTDCSESGQHTVLLQELLVRGSETIEHDSLSYDLCTTHLHTHAKRMADCALANGYTISVL